MLCQKIHLLSTTSCIGGKKTGYQLLWSISILLTYRNTSLWPYYPATWLWPTLPNMDTAELFSHALAVLVCHIRPLWLRSSADSESHHWHVLDMRPSTKFKVWHVLTTPQGWTIWQWHLQNEMLQTWCVLGACKKIWWHFACKKPHRAYINHFMI